MVRERDAVHADGRVVRAPDALDEVARGAARHDAVGDDLELVVEVRRPRRRHAVLDLDDDGPRGPVVDVDLVGQAVDVADDAEELAGGAGGEVVVGVAVGRVGRGAVVGREARQRGRTE